MTDTTVPGFIRPIQLENVRVFPKRGKESQQLLLLMGTAAAPITTDFKATPRPEMVDNGVKTLRRTPGSYLTLILSSYPNDVTTGFDNFNGWPPAEPSFIQQWADKGLVPAQTTYVAYNPGPDIFYPQFRRTPQFIGQPDFIKQQPQFLVTAAQFFPLPPSDNTFRARMSTQAYSPEVFTQIWKPFWFVVLVPTVPLPPTNFFAGAGPVQGTFSGNVIIGVFN